MSANGVKEKITEKIEEIQEASDIMQPVEDLHLWDELKKLASEIGKASEQMIPIKDLHIGKDLKRMAKEIEDAQNIMFRFPESKAEHSFTLLKSYLNLEEKPVLLCDLENKVLVANKAAKDKFGPDIEDGNAGDLGLKRVVLKDAHGLLSGYCFTEE